MSITKLDQVVELVKSQPKKRLVAANANDAHTIEAVNAAALLAKEALRAKMKELSGGVDLDLPGLM